MARLYQIHLRQFMVRNDYNNSFKNLREFPIEFLDYLQSLGFSHLWLMGTWQLPTDSRQLNFSFQNFPNVSRDKLISSVFAIDSYNIDQNLGSLDDYLFVKQEANKRGIKIILDFIPNHFGIFSSFTQTNPEIFLKIKNEFQSGRDPNYPAWLDTAQLDYSKQITRDFMAKQLLNISKICDGVRVDMAMLLLNSVFEKTWSFKIENQKEFWSESLSALKKFKTDFVTIAECYWDLEPRLIELGFDYVYYKPFLDQLVSNQSLNSKTEGINQINQKLVCFLENHDEKRSASIWQGEALKNKINLLVQAKGIGLYYHGQLEGNLIRTPIQLIQTPLEEINRVIKNYYLEKFRETSYIDKT